MNYFGNVIIVSLLAVLILCCVKRQRRYWLELQESRPSGSLRWGYRIAIVSILGTFSLAVISDSPSAWQTFLGVASVALIFCVKITFSPIAIALTLVACSIELLENGSFPLLTVWTSLTRIITWRLPEEFRIVYSCVSLLWTIMVFVNTGGGGSAAEKEDSTMDSLAGLST